MKRHATKQSDDDDQRESSSVGMRRSGRKDPLLRVDEVLATIHVTHRGTIKAFLDEKSSTTQRASSVLTTLYHLKPWSDFLVKQALDDGRASPKSFEEVTRTDVRPYAASCGRGYSVSVEDERKMYLKSFQRFVRGGSSGDGYPPEVEWLKKFKKKNKNLSERIRQRKIISREYLARIIGRQRTPLKRAIAAVLYDSGARRSELVALRAGGVEVHEHHAVLDLPFVDSREVGLKTGQQADHHHSRPAIPSAVDERPPVSGRPRSSALRERSAPEPLGRAHSRRARGHDTSDVLGCRRAPFYCARLPA
jgi:site-specific recombinase XerD